MGNELKIQPYYAQHFSNLCPICVDRRNLQKQKKRELKGKFENFNPTSLEKESLPNNPFATTFPLYNVFFFSTFMYNDVREFYIGTSIGLLPKASEPKRIYYGNVSVSVFMFFCVLLSILFMYLENLQISRPSYNAKLHSCSPDTLNKGFPFSSFPHAT